MFPIQPSSHDPELDVEAPTVRRVRDEPQRTAPVQVEAIANAEDKTVISGRPIRDVAVAGTPAEIATVLIGRQLDHFLLEELIGGGGMGAVFRARDTRLDRVVAVKVLPGVGQDPDLLRRFRVEAQSAARLDHPHIARIYDVGEYEGWHYIVFEFIEGSNVRDLVHRQGPLSIEQALSFTYQAAEALQHASQRGVVHRDVKPSNLLVDSLGHVRLVDMGLARANAMEMSDDLTASNVTLGTFDYISPEQARDPRVADVRSDLYSLGCTLYFMLTGEPPFPGGTVVQKLMHHGSTPPPDPRLYREDVSADLSAVTAKLLSKDPESRYQEPSDLLSDLVELARREQRTLSLASPAAVSTTVSMSAWWLYHSPWMVALAALVISIVSLRLMVVPARDFEEPEGISVGKAPPIALSSQSILDPRPDRSDILREPAPSASDEASVSTDADRITNVSPPKPNGNEIIVVGSVASSALSGIETVLSLTDALRRVAENPSLQVIEIDRDHLSTPHIKLPKNGLTIRAAAGRSPLIQFEETSAHYFHDRIIVIDGAGHDLQIEGVHLRWRVPPLAKNGANLIQLGLGNRLTVRNASLTIENPEQLEDVSAFGVSNGSHRAAIVADATATETTIRCEDFVARGEMGLILLEEPSGISLQLRRGLVAISESVLQMTGESRTTGTPPRLQFSLERMTLHAKHLAEVWLEPGTRSIPRIERKSMDSIFALQPNRGLIEYQYIAIGMLPATVPWSLEGSGNRYERPQDPLVRVSSAGDRRQEWTYGEALKYDWMKEAQTKTGVSWSGPWPIGKSLHEVEPHDFAQQDTDVGFPLDFQLMLPQPVVDELD